MPHLASTSTHAEEAMSIKYNTMVYDMKAAGHDVIVMSLGEAFFDIPLMPFDDLPFPDIYHYSHSRGVPQLREKIAEYYKTQYGAGFDPASEIIVTAGSKVAIYMSLMAIIEDGDEVLYSEPTWVSYPEQIKLCRGVPVGLPYDHPVTDFRQFITRKTRAIIVTNPHNPRGQVLSEEELTHLVELARQHNLWLLCDEAYSDFVQDGSFTSLAKIDAKKTNSIVFNSLSKNLGLSGWRLGYVIANPELIFQVLKLNQHLITCPATILEHYVCKHFDRILAITKPQMAEVARRREALARHMDQIGLTYLAGGATFYFFVSTGASRLGSEDFCTKLLRERHVATVPGVGYGPSCDKFIRVSIGTASMDDNKRGLDRIKQLIEQTS
jgi:aspartate aminotransferase/aminotransferase